MKQHFFSHDLQFHTKCNLGNIARNISDTALTKAESNKCELACLQDQALLLSIVVNNEFFIIVDIHIRHKGSVTRGSMKNPTANSARLLCHSS